MTASQATVWADAPQDRGVAERRGLQLALDLAGQRVPDLVQRGQRPVGAEVGASPALVLSTALVEACSVAAPNWPTLELSCL